MWCSLHLPGSVEWLTCQARWAPSLNYHPDGGHPGVVPTQAALATHCALGNALPHVLTESTWGSGSTGSSSDWPSSADVQEEKVKGRAGSESRRHEDEHERENASSWHGHLNSKEFKATKRTGFQYSTWEMLMNAFKLKWCV